MPPHQITRLLIQAREGDRNAFDAAFGAVYERLHAMAHRQLIKERQGHTLSATALVHEAYMHLVDQSKANWQDRGHFFSMAALAMRRILVDYARRHKAQKRGGGLAKRTLDTSVPVQERSDELLALDEALDRLKALNQRLAQVVELRYFAGLADEEIAEVLQISDRTVRRDWVKARGWLFNDIYGGDA